MSRKLYYLLPLLAIGACKTDPNKKIERKWQETEIVNTEMQMRIDQTKRFLDTVGTHTTPEQNVALYGAANIDSMKRETQQSLDGYFRDQQRVIDNTWFDFHKDGKLFIHSERGLDSAAWYFDKDKKLVFDENKLKGKGEKLTCDVVALTDTMLRLKFSSQGMTSEAIFKPAKN